MTATDRQTRGEGLLGLAALLAVARAAGVFTGTAHLGAVLDGDGVRLPWHPLVLALQLRSGEAAWPEHGWLALALLTLPAIVLAGLVGVLVGRARRGRKTIDRAAAHLGRGKDLADLSTAGATKTARRLGVATPGFPVGRAVAGGQPLWQDFEAVAVWIIGPRGGKTTSAAITAILSVPQCPVLATSNKRDSTDATRDLRALTGRVWVFDPMGLADEEPTWWWNPLGAVHDEVSGLKLARVLVGAARDPGARTDAYFDKAGPSLIGNLLLAAARGKDPETGRPDPRPITQVYDWLTDSLDDEPARLLKAAGFTRSAKAVQAVIRMEPKQRGGIYGTAQELMSFLISSRTEQWVTDPTGRRPEFAPAAFVVSTDTLYLLSKEGDASAGPLVTALTVAVTEAGEAEAKTCPGGRLRVPLLLCLDEAANICRWHSLPDLYSHLGSRGMPVITFLQSWSQGVDVWGREGMRKLWSAANLRVVGAGVSEDEFLEGLSKLTGTFRDVTRSGSAGKDSRSRSWSEHRERVLDVADLGAIPKGRAVLFSTGVRPVLLRLVPWMAGPHREAVEASIAAHDPSAAVTLADAAVPDDVWAAA